jgi:hypothetical protein
MEWALLTSEMHIRNHADSSSAHNHMSDPDYPFLRRSEIKRTFHLPTITFLIQISHSCAHQKSNAHFTGAEPDL